MLKTVVARCYEVLGNEDTAEVVDNIKNIGFEYATQSGITIAVNDLRVPAEKKQLIEARKRRSRRSTANTRQASSRSRSATTQPLTCGARRQKK